MRQRKHHHRGQDVPQTITKAVTHIRLEAVNAGKLAALDSLAQVYLSLCQQYVTLFCTEEHPTSSAPLCLSPPSPSGGTGWPSSRRRVSLGPGAPIAPRPTRTMRMICGYHEQKEMARGRRGGRTGVERMEHPDAAADLHPGQYQRGRPRTLARLEL